MSRRYPCDLSDRVNWQLIFKFVERIARMPMRLENQRELTYARQDFIDHGFGADL